MEKLPIGWFDLVLATLLIVGMVRGRKRGVSEELLDVLKWLFIVFLGAVAYRPLGNLLAEVTPFSHLSCYVAVYAIIVGAGWMTFASIKQAVGEKVVASEAFGDGEYYLGIFAGGFRYACIILVVLTFVHARQYKPHEANSQVQSQMKDFGMVFFTVPILQDEIFKYSFLGRQIDTYLTPFMIEPVPLEFKALGQKGTSTRAREKSVSEIFK
jgi:uncharacterized membrane protein required for colicin V production